jgi:glycosyltransferase involved in cell wall biosynthesis
VSEGPLISVVVPAWREERLISGCLASVVAQRGGGVSFELLVIDGGSEDGTVERALAFPEVDLREAPRGKASQMNAGGRVSRGRWILFLPADTRLAPGALGAVGALDRRQEIVGGGFAVRFESSRPSMRAAGCLHTWRARVTGVPYGDQALFLRREAWESLGGVSEEHPLPDVDLGRRLRRLGRTAILRDHPVSTSARRFLRHGPLRTMAAAAGILGWERLTGRVPPSKIFSNDDR